MITFGRERNELLKQNRGIGFEEIIAAINAGKIPGVFGHPDQTQYPHPKIYVVEALDYVYLVPFIQNEDGIFLKTAFCKMRLE